MGIVSVDEVTRGKALTRFLDLPQVLHGHDPRFAPPVQAWERYRVARRNPYFERGDAVLFSAWSDARLVGRIAAHVPGPVAEHGGEGRVGLWATIDDEEVAAELVGAAAGWLREQGCTSVSGPWSWTADDEPGALVEGDAHPGTTGRPWRPRWEAERLAAALGGDATVIEESRSWRIALAGPTDDSAPPADRPAPGQAGSYADQRLVLDGIAAVPDVSSMLRGAGLGSAWSQARKVRRAEWEGCTVVRCHGDPTVLVPQVAAAAAAAGYAWAVVPWWHEGAPDTVHRRWSAPL